MSSNTSIAGKPRKDVPIKWNDFTANGIQSNKRAVCASDLHSACASGDTCSDEFAQCVDVEGTLQCECVESTTEVDGVCRTGWFIKCTGRE